jgi:hypothetical protein
MPKIRTPKEVKIEFAPEFNHDVYYGQKIVTTRTKRKAKPLDYFWLNNEDNTGRTKFVVLAVFRLSLSHIAYHLYPAEGFAHPDDFIAAWNKIYPKYPYEQYKMASFFVHVFTPAHEWYGYEPVYEKIETTTLSQDEIKQVKKS